MKHLYHCIDEKINSMYMKMKTMNMKTMYGIADILKWESYKKECDIETYSDIM